MGCANPGGAWAAPRAIRRQLPRLALPIVGANFLQGGVGIVDAVLAGHVGADALAAVGLGNLLLTFVMALVFGLGVGSAVLVAFRTARGCGCRRRTCWACWRDGDSLWCGSPCS